MAFIGRPSATNWRSSSSAGDTSPTDVPGLTSAWTIDGSRSDPPMATSRMARASWSPSASRSSSRYAYLAEPSARRAMAYSGSSYWERTTTAVPGGRLRTSLAASITSRWKLGGKRMSVTTTWAAAASAPAARPSSSAAAPTTTRSGTRLIRARTPSMRLSSARNTVIWRSGTAPFGPIRRPGTRGQPSLGRGCQRPPAPFVRCVLNRRANLRTAPSPTSLAKKRPGVSQVAVGALLGQLPPRPPRPPWMIEG